MSEQPTRSHGWRIATVGGVPVYLGRSWPIIVIFVVVTFAPVIDVGRSDVYRYSVALAYAILLLFSVLAHEAAHAVVARRFGMRVDRVVADLWGGHTVYQSDNSRPGSSAAIAVAGPIANGVVAGLAWVGFSAADGLTARLLLFALFATNAFVAVFNLLPGLPLDGGYLVEAVVWKVTRDRNTALVVAGWLGRIVTIVVAAWFIVRPMVSGQRPELMSIVWIAFVGAFLWNGATQAIRTGRIRGRLAVVPVATVVAPTVTTSYAGSVASALAAAARLSGPGYVVALDPAGRPLGLVDQAAVSAVPADQRMDTPVAAVVSVQPATWVVTARPDQGVTELVEVMQSTRLSLLVLVDDGGTVLGVVTADAVGQALGARA